MDNGVRLLDVDDDGFIDVVVGNEKAKQTRTWSAKKKAYVESDFPMVLNGRSSGVGEGYATDLGHRFGVLRPDGHASFLYSTYTRKTGYHFDGGKWVEDRELANGLNIETGLVGTHGSRLRDLDGDGRCELIYTTEVSNQPGAVFTWNAEKKRWARLPFA